MSEMVKTIAFVAIAAASLLLGFIVKPSEDTFDVEEFVGEKLNQFEVNDPKRLKIVKFDAKTATSSEFEVAAQEGLWTIPSKQGYPADAAEQMAEAATCLIDRQILKVAATSASEHRELGVINPSSGNLGSNAAGVGTRVIMTNASGENLVDMIIGKPVKDAEGQRFVRNTNQDVVYVVELNPEKLSTQFEDWIEDDLLQLNPLDIRNVRINDYSATLQPVLAAGGIQMQVSWDRRAQMALQFNSADSKWTVNNLEQFDPDQETFVSRQIAEDEELNEEALNGLRNGLDDLLLVDVERKPDGLSADLKAGSDFLNNNEAINSLVDRGFAPLKVAEDSDVEILSSEGEVICTLSNGVEYVLRFGNLKLASQTAAPSVEDSEEAPSEAGDDVQRYLFVMARFNEAAVEKPELDDLPELPENATNDQPEETESPAADEATQEDVGSDEEVETAESADSDATPAQGDSSEEEATAETESEEPAEAEPDSGEASEENSDENSNTNDSSSNEVTEAESGSDDAEPTDEIEGAEQETSDELEKLIAERKSIETENQRKLDEYQEKIKSGQDKTRQLNERFGDWYYVISNDVYKKIHLSLDQVISKKAQEETEGDEAAADSGSDLPGLPGLPGLPVETPAETTEEQ